MTATSPPTAPAPATSSALVRNESDSEREADPLPAVDERGRTRIADRVVEKIAARAVAEVDAATGVARRVLGVSLGSTGPDARARVDADVDGGVVTVRASMAVRWPASVRSVTRQVRTNVTDRVQELTGLSVEYVDIDVPELLTDTSDETRRVI